MEERVQKILARFGYGSRRSCEEIILGGRVKINGITAVLGSKADTSKDTIQVDGRVLPKDNPEMVYIALNKPRGVLSDEDPQDQRPTVRNLVPISGHLFTVGRLDLNSEGLILLTNDGDLANKLSHPRYHHEKEYRVLVASRPDREQLEAWRRGVVMEDGKKTLPAQVEVTSTLGKGAWLNIILFEGRKRQIREVGSRIGLPVVKLTRVRIGTLLLGNLKPREWRFLTPQEIDELKKLTRLDAKKAKPTSERIPLKPRPIPTVRKKKPAL